MTIVRSAALFCGLLLTTSALPAQVSAYASFSATDLNGNGYANVLYGSTTGINLLLAAKAHIDFGIDVRASFLVGRPSYYLIGEQSLYQVSLGPTLAVSHKKYKAYGEFLVGFARFNPAQGPTNPASTDSALSIVAGLDRRLTRHLDLKLLDYTYELYDGQYQNYVPKTFSTGIVYRFLAR